MGIFSKPKTKVVEKTAEADEEKKSTRAEKQRLTETEGGNKGQLLNEAQGKSVRRIFG